MKKLLGVTVFVFLAILVTKYLLPFVFCADCGIKFPITSKKLKLEQSQELFSHDPPCNFSDLQSCYLNIPLIESTEEPSEGMGKINLLELAKYLKGHSKFNIQIEGHVPSGGAPEKEMLRSDQLAKKFKERLIKEGVPERRISSIAYGSEKPLVLPSTDKSNLRIWIDYIGFGFSDIINPEQ